MKSKTALFLIVAASISILLSAMNLAYTISNFGEYLNWRIFVFFAIFTLSSLGYILYGVTLVKDDPKRRKPIAIGSAVVTLAGFGISLYTRIIIFQEHGFWNDALTNIVSLMNFTYSIFIVVFWIMLSLGKLRKAALWLFLGALVGVFGMFAATLERFFSFRFRFDLSWHTTLDIMFVLSLLLPISLLAFSLSILKEKPAGQGVKYNPESEPVDALGTSEAEEYPVPTIYHWFSDFLMTMIPLVGMGFLAWRGLNKEDRIRRNWAIAALFWMIPMLALLLLAYYPVLTYIQQGNSILWIVLMVIGILITLFVLALNKASNDDFDDQLENPPYPSIGKWMGWYFVATLPFAGFICLIIWAIDTENHARKNWATAQLVWAGAMFLYYLNIYSAFLDVYRINHMTPNF